MLWNDDDDDDDDDGNVESSGRGSGNNHMIVVVMMLHCSRDLCSLIHRIRPTCMCNLFPEWDAYFPGPHLYMDPYSHKEKCYRKRQSLPKGLNLQQSLFLGSYSHTGLNY